MPLTIEQIEQKEFSIQPSGYSEIEVDNFLDEICDHIFELEQKIFSLEKKLKQSNNAQRMLEANHWGAPMQPKQDSSMTSAQMLLSETNAACAKVIEDAKKRAEDIISLARSSAGDGILMRLELKKKTLTEEIAYLQRSAENLRTQINDMLLIRQE